MQNSTNSIANFYVINNNNKIHFIVKSLKNIDFFDSTLKNFLKKNFDIVIVDCYTYYRNVYFFINQLKNLKKSFFDFKIKKYIIDCIKDEI